MSELRMECRIVVTFLHERRALGHFETRDVAALPNTKFINCCPSQNAKKKNGVWYTEMAKKSLS